MALKVAGVKIVSTLNIPLLVCKGDIHLMASVRLPEAEIVDHSTVVG